MNNLDKIIAFRESGAVRRAHTFFHHGEYNVATHCYNAVNILLVLNPNASINLVKAVLWHDVAERWTGDLPAPVKWHSSELKKVLKGIEKEINDKLEISTVFENLDDDEKIWLHAVDSLELYFWSVEQINMGNNGVRNIIAILDVNFARSIDYLPAVVYEAYSNYIYKTTPECGELLAK